MKLVSYLHNGIYDTGERLGVVINEQVYPTRYLGPGFPATMQELLTNWYNYYPLLVKASKEITDGKKSYVHSEPLQNVVLLAPVTHPTSCRDGYAFRQHVETARRNRHVPMIPQFDEYPVFYFTNHNSIAGPGVLPCMPDHFHKLDFELEVAIVICKKGRNIRAEEADQYIGGLMIMNDFSARTLQMEEMLLNLGPAKGKDFATVLGPWLVTPDELAPFSTGTKPGHTGKTWDIVMRCHVNGIQVSEGTMKDMDWTFAEIIERASYGVDLYPGDVIGSGTVGTGCFLELNGTGKLNDPGYKEQWLQPGDIIEMTVDGLGTLRNTVVKEKTDWSILNKKKRYAAAPL